MHSAPDEGQTEEIVTVSADSSKATRSGIHAERFDDEVVLRFPSLSRLIRAVLPNEAVTHIQAAQREQLLGLRAVLDAAIARIEAAERGETQTVSRTDIRID
jgi:hypothetical protein